MRQLIIVPAFAAMMTACVHTAPTSHLNVPVANFGGILANDFGGVGTFVVFGPTAGVGLSSANPAVPVNPGFDFVITDIDYTLRAGSAAVCNPADAGKQISLVISVGGVRNYLLEGRLDDNCSFRGRDYMTAGFVVGAGKELSGGTTCTGCVGQPKATLQLRGYVVPQPAP
jgi:hypothetical protein